MLIKTTTNCVGREGKSKTEKVWPKGRVVEVEDALAERFFALGGAVAATQADLDEQAVNDKWQADYDAMMKAASEKANAS